MRLNEGGSEVQHQSGADPLASITSEIATAMAQAQAPNLSAFDSDGDNDSGSGQEMDEPARIRPKTSGIRGIALDPQLVGGDDDEENGFQIPLRTRRAVRGVAPVVGAKRKTISS